MADVATPEEVATWPGHRPQGTPVWPTCVHADGYEHPAQIVGGMAVLPCDTARLIAVIKARDAGAED